MRNLQGMAALEAAVYHQVHLDKEHDVSKAMRLTGRYFVDVAMRLRKDYADKLRAGEKIPELDNLGVPRPHLFLALAGAVAQQGEKIGPPA